MLWISHWLEYPFKTHGFRLAFLSYDHVDFQLLLSFLNNKFYKYCDILFYLCLILITYHVYC